MRKLPYRLLPALVLPITYLLSGGVLFPGLCAAQSFSVQEQRRYETEARDVTIIRDKWGIPHIYGKTDASTVFGLMYAECQEDFSRVEKNYLEMLGRQAEASGMIPSVKRKPVASSASWPGVRMVIEMLCS